MRNVNKQSDFYVSHAKNDYFFRIFAKNYIIY